MFQLSVWCEKWVAARHNSVIGNQLLFANNRNNFRWVVLCLSHDGACADSFENFREISLKGGLSNDITLSPPLFSLVNTFKNYDRQFIKMTGSICCFKKIMEQIFWGWSDPETYFWIQNRIRPFWQLKLSSWSNSFLKVTRFVVDCKNTVPFWARKKSWCSPMRTSFLPGLNIIVGMIWRIWRWYGKIDLVSKTQGYKILHWFVCGGAQVSRRRRRVRRGRSRTWPGRSPPPRSSPTLTRPSSTSQSPGSTGRPITSYLRLFICLVDRCLLAIFFSFILAKSSPALVIWFPVFLAIVSYSYRDSVTMKIF